MRLVAATSSSRGPMSSPFFARACTFADDCCDSGRCVEKVAEEDLTKVHDRIAHDMNVQTGRAESVHRMGDMVRTELNFDATEGLVAKEHELPTDRASTKKKKRRREKKAKRAMTETM